MKGRRSAFVWVLEIISIAAVAAMFLHIAAYWPDLPDRVPRHFGFSGKPNARGSKAGLWFLPAVGCAALALMSFASKYQSLVNLPVRVDRQNPEVQDLISEMMAVLKTALALTFFYLSWASVNTALGKTNGLSSAFLPVSLAAMLIPVIYYTWRLRIYRRNE